MMNYASLLLVDPVGKRFTTKRSVDEKIPEGSEGIVKSASHGGRMVRVEFAAVPGAEYVMERIDLNEVIEPTTGEQITLSFHPTDSDHDEIT